MTSWKQVSVAVISSGPFQKDLDADAGGRPLRNAVEPPGIAADPELSAKTISGLENLIQFELELLADDRAASALPDFARLVMHDLDLQFGSRLLDDPCAAVLQPPVAAEVRQSRLPVPGRRSGDQARRSRECKRDQPSPSLGLRPQRRARRREFLLDDAREPLDVIIPARFRQLVRLATRERLQRFRQVALRWDAGTFHQHRYDSHSRRERMTDLQTNEVVRIVESPPPVRGRSQPRLADDGEQHAAVAQRLVEPRDEVLSRRDVLDVAEHLVGAETSPEVVRQPPRESGATFTPIA